MTGGYRLLRKRMELNPLPPWNERLPWHSGEAPQPAAKDINLNNLVLNRRYQLSEDESVLA